MLPAIDFNGISNTCRLVGVDLAFTQDWNMLVLRGEVLRGEHTNYEFQIGRSRTATWKSPFARAGISTFNL